MRITEAVRVLQDEFPRFSKSKLTTCLKIEMKKIEAREGDNAVNVDVAAEALGVARRVIASGALTAAAQSDPTGNEVANREGRGKHWKLEHMHGVSAPRMRIGRQDP